VQAGERRRPITSVMRDGSVAVEVKAKTNSPSARVIARPVLPTYAMPAPHAGAASTRSVAVPLAAANRITTCTPAPVRGH